QTFSKTTLPPWAANPAHHSSSCSFRVLPNEATGKAAEPLNDAMKPHDDFVRFRDDVRALRHVEYSAHGSPFAHHVARLKEPIVRIIPKRHRAPRLRMLGDERCEGALDGLRVIVECQVAANAAHCLFKFWAVDKYQERGKAPLGEVVAPVY